MAAFKRNLDLYPQSANVYDSLADCLEAGGKPDEAMKSVQKAVDVATENRDPLLPEFQKHLQRLVASGKSAPSSAGKKQ
jgi:hypothetical protein